MVKHSRIFAINGEGMRGIILAKIIQKITDISKKPVHELFDYVGL